MTYPLPASLQRIHALGQDIAAARANPDIAPDNQVDPGGVRLAAPNNCIPCAGEKNWESRCTCIAACRSPRCSAAADADDPLHPYNKLPLPRWLACACCHSPSRAPLIPLGPHHVCTDCWDLIGSPACPKAWRAPVLPSTTIQE